MEFKPSRRPSASERNAAPARRAAPAQRGGSGVGSKGRSAQPGGAHAPRSNGEGAFVRNAPRRPKRDPAAVIIPILIALALLAGVVYVGSNWFVATLNDSTYLNNVYVNGVNLNSFKKEEGVEYMRALIEQRLSTGYTLRWGDASWSFTAADFGASIDIEPIMERAWNFGHVGNIFDRSATVRSLNRAPIYLEANVSCDEGLVTSFVSAMADQLYIAPKDAQVVADLNNPYLASDSVPGQELDQDTARMQIIDLIETGEGSDVLPVLEVEPALSTDEAMGTLELIVDYKTDVTARGYNGRFNVRKGLSYFHGMVVQPGEEISFNDVVGPRTKERGWQPGTEYIGGGRTQEGYGGGICQASTTLYGALLKAGMTILERWPHSMTVAYVEPSLDAAVAESGVKNLRFRNDTDYAITIYTEVTKEYAQVRIYGMKPKYRYELESVILQQDKHATRVGYVDDVDGKYCTYTDETLLYSEGHAACASQGWRVAYDWETGQEVERYHLSNDQYSSGYDIYWRGVQDRGGGTPTANEAPAE